MIRQFAREPTEDTQDFDCRCFYCRTSSPTISLWALSRMNTTRMGAGSARVIQSAGSGHVRRGYQNEVKEPAPKSARRVIFMIGFIHAIFRQHSSILMAGPTQRERSLLNDGLFLQQLLMTGPRFARSVAQAIAQHERGCRVTRSGLGTRGSPHLRWHDVELAPALHARRRVLHDHDEPTDRRGE